MINKTGLDLQEDNTDSTGDRLETEVAIVGAGPAGCILAYLLARSGVETILIERRTNLSREFRGYGFQPPVLRLFDDLGLLDDVLALPHRKLQSGNIVAYDKPFTMFDWREDSSSFDYALQMDQGPLIELLIEEARGRNCFTYVNGTTVTDLIREDGSVVGVEATERSNGTQLSIRSRLVVGADGRFSTVRDCTGIADGRSGSELELLWFKLSSSPTDLTTHLRIADEGVLVYAPLNETEGQYGLFIERGSYPAVRETGFDSFRNRVSAIEPSLRDAVWYDLDDFTDCVLLDIEPGITPEWRRDGLLLIGDAAHIASPFGEGNVLAMHDAVRAHPEIVAAIQQGDNIVPKAALVAFERARRETVRESLEGSAHLQGLMSFVTGKSRLPQPIQRSVVRNLFRGMWLLRTLADRVPHGITDEQYVPVRSSLFTK